MRPERDSNLNLVNRLTDAEVLALAYDWSVWARPEQQLAREDYYCHLYLAGRGWGKTRVGAEQVIEWAKDPANSPIALVGATRNDTRSTMTEIGASSIMERCHPANRPTYEPSKRRLTFPNGVVCLTYSGDSPGQLRGPQHARAWVDELCKMPLQQEVWDNLVLGLRVPPNPQVIVTTTPRPTTLLKSLVEAARQTSTRSRTIITRGRTMDNRANLSSSFLDYVNSKYGGTRLGRQELEGEILESLAGLVYDAFTPEQCIIPRFAIPSEWNRYFAIDFGRVNTAALWYAQEPSTGFLYLYRTYKQKASVIDHVKNFQALSKGEVFRRKVGGNHQEQEARDGYSIAGWHVAEPSLSNSRVERMRRVNTLHAQNRVYIFSDLSEYIDEKLSFSYTVNQDDSLTDRIHNESAFHFMSAEGYLLSEFRPEVERKDDNKIRVIVR